LGTGKPAQDDFKIINESLVPFFACPSGKPVNVRSPDSCILFHVS
jgi:hypothetical protein